MDDDRTLYLRWLSARDEAAFGALARRNADLVVDVAWRASGDLPAAEDALQEALLALARDRTERPAQVGVRAWLARAAILAARHGRASERARARRERAVGAARGEAAMDPGRDEAAAAVREALGRLDADAATALALRYVHGIEYPEIAAILDVEEPTARVRVHRAIERLRAEARRGDLDEARLASLLLAAPRAAATSARVESAIAAASSAAAPPVPVGIPAASAATAAATAAAGTSRLVAALLALGVVGGVVAFLAWRAGEPHGTETSRTAVAGGDGPRNEPRLEGRARRAAETAAEDPSDGEAVEPGTPGPAPAPSRARRREDEPAKRVTLRMDLVLPNGDTEEVAIDRVHHRGNERRVDPDEPAAVETHPGWIVNVTTADPRAAFPTLWVRVPDPVPTTLVVRVPRVDHPRLHPLVLEVVDAMEGKPIEGAVAEWPPALGPSATADARGRVRVELPADRDLRVGVLAALTNGRANVHASGYRAHGGTTFPGLKETAATLEAAAIEAWMRSGAWRVALARLPADMGFVERDVRLVDGGGRPLVGATVFADHAFSAPAWKTRVVLGASVTPRDMLGAGLRRTRADGVIRLAMREFIGLELRVDDVPFMAWGLSAEEWPKEGARDVRVPERCDVEIAVEGAPEGGGSWGRDRLGAARTPTDGPADGRHVVYDRTAQKAVEAGTVFPVWMGDVGGTLDAEHPTIRLPLAVGYSCRLYVSAGEENRTLDVTPTAAGTLRVVRRWGELPLLPRDPYRPSGWSVPGKPVPGESVPGGSVPPK